MLSFFSCRICTLTGSLEAIALAKELINKVISNENDKAAMRGNLPTDTNCGGLHEMRIIGKGGEIIKALQEETGAKIVIIQESREYAAEKPLRITGSPEAVEMARIRVEAVLAHEMEKVGGGGSAAGIRRGWATNNNNYTLAHAQTVCFEAGVQGQEVTEVISIPSSKVGLVMGRGGETIRQICMASGAHCQVRRRSYKMFLFICFLFSSRLTRMPLTEQERRTSSSRAAQAMFKRLRYVTFSFLLLINCLIQFS